MITPEIIDQVYGGISIKAVLTFRMKVKRTIEIPSDAAIVKAFFLFVEADSPPPAIELPTISGSKGSVHGARIVRIPAMKESKNRNMLF